MPAGASSLRAKSLDAILALWAQELGLTAPDLIAPADGVTLTASSSLPGIFVFRRGSDLRIAATYQKLEDIHSAIIGQTFAKILAPKFWQRLPELCGEAVGPALVFYLDSVPAEWAVGCPRNVSVRGLSSMDAKSFIEFAEALTSEEREESGLEFGPRPLWGVFREKKLLAVAGYDAWPWQIAHLGVAVHPDHRRQKLGQLAVQAASRGALTRRRVVQYRTLTKNDASVGLAHAMHFIPVVETLYIRPPVAT